MAHVGSRKRSRSRSRSRGRGSEKKRKKSSKDAPRSCSASRSQTAPSPCATERSKHRARRRPRSSPSSSPSSSSSGSSSSDGRRKRGKHKGRKRKKKKKRKKPPKKRDKDEAKVQQTEALPGPSLDQWHRAAEEDEDGPVLTDEQKSRIQAMKPMTKEEWDARQSVIRKVVDPETGRTRLIKGDGEVLEEIVTKERHREINKQATRGDGLAFQMRAGLLP
ncbi:PREDICTED: ADP-ribosylation factor-like protein 6-interacting protein 4 isoform X3 [Lipotes vexillifer]|uniref:ADP-ribosylation factor-like protein 6-interacting protein 4 n=1 Tax=Lipotes vexillifer TaxID=118797 RepID=A0A340WM80_LIPVE|nr:PREDICTED: ADP-ribosylation factor-like protein 6-interacting protein 4 isoform X3 [Lipotes vexillifer]